MCRSNVFPYKIRYSSSYSVIFASVWKTQYSDYISFSQVTEERSSWNIRPLSWQWRKLRPTVSLVPTELPVSFRSASSKQSPRPRVDPPPTYKKQKSIDDFHRRGWFEIFKPRWSAFEFALSSGSRSSTASGCAPRSRDCEYRVVLAFSTSFVMAKPCWWHFRKLRPTPSSRSQLRQRRACR